MKALTICEPYASLICDRRKLVENRTWWTSYRGPLLVHAGKSQDHIGPTLESNWGIPLEKMHFGFVVCQVTLVDCVKHDNLYKPDRQGDALRRRYPWLQGHEHASGPYCWVLERPVVFAVPVPWRGSQGLYDIDEAQIRSAQHEGGLASGATGVQNLF